MKQVVSYLCEIQLFFFNLREVQTVRTVFRVLLISDRPLVEILVKHFIYSTGLFFVIPSTF